MSESIFDEYPSMTLEKASDDTSIEPLKLGVRIKEIRTQLGITLEEASQRTGLARSTLSKIENEQISPTFQAMQKLATGLSINMPQLFEPPVKKQASGRRDITLKGEGKPHPTPTYEHELLATQLSNKRMMPFKSRIHARAFDEYQDWVRHDGEEFLLILDGEVLFYSEFYEPLAMREGDSVYYDANMGHMLVSTSTEDAQILWVTAK
ncbi:helix-turn-helix domain-containing protein [Vibrio ulleungensis]|jgi:transcriptional regulator with XRE-family HTH domain|uniref:Helix-turn-helix domain-containing protein n=1 Tax=Vibrio ulleungensis TaxID=2807619 RepID=A0ABS2HDV8_9VIBR|nr:XRE family transcriptional regulator [Vibrio ulleungensis]MBM7035194.1 helix-turn-helix domain-containing protein [Vibrio ulleungensis]